MTKLLFVAGAIAIVAVIIYSQRDRLKTAWYMFDYYFLKR